MIVIGRIVAINQQVAAYNRSEFLIDPNFECRSKGFSNFEVTKMINKSTLTVSLKLLLLLSVFGGILFALNRGQTAQQAQEDERRLRIQVHQLPPRFQDRMLLRCDDAILATPTEVKEVTCYITNNSSKVVVAGGLSITYLLDDNGVSAPQSAVLSFDSLLQPDLLTEHPEGVIPPGGQYRLRDIPTTLDRPITAIIAFLDYIEFSDSTKEGPDKGSSQLINAQRVGARKYQQWLAKKYEEKRSVETVVAFLNSDDDIPSELAITDPNEAQGARIFRRQERRVYETKGADILLKHIKGTR